MSEAKDSLRSNDQPVMGNAVFVPPHSSLPKLEREALMGSGDAALKLAGYYQYVVNDPNQALYWYTISAENGSLSGMYNLAFMLNAYTDPKNHGSKNFVRARFWLNKIRKENPPTSSDAAADSLLREINENHPLPNVEAATAP